MFILYDLIFILFALFYLPIYILRRKFHPGFLMRLGIYPKKIKEQLRGVRPIWLHAVSVGEALASRRLLEGLHSEYPGKQIIISTVTPAGNKIALSIAKERDSVIYLPLDISFIVKYVLSFINPSVFIIAETEIWPNLISCLNTRNVPVIVVNARISDGSYRGYRLIKFLLKPILDKINLFCVQTETDYLRLLDLGAEEEKIKITGNMKFDNHACLPAGREDTDFFTDYTQFRRKLGLKDNERLMVAGSTHHGEEEIILNAYKELSRGFPEARLLIAPRHPERSREIERLALNYGFAVVFISGLPAPRVSAGQPATVFILDTIGQLMNFYAIADIVFVGGSLIKKGGHNILEPAVYGKPIIFGPWMFNFRDIASLFLKHKASLLVHNEGELKESIKNLLNNPAAAQELGRRAKELIAQNQGAATRNLENIKNYLPVS
ncbi:MAG: 3-deoxy-D-manno-octulosonic acid transferase [Patescibacteria group bacterium]